MSDECKFSAPESDICPTPEERAQMASLLMEMSGFVSMSPDMLHELAGYIDPTTTARWDAMHAVCNACGECVETERETVPNYCPSCGARITNWEELS